MEGWWYFVQANKESLLRGKKLIEEAIALDPSYAYAYSLLGGVHGALMYMGIAKSPQESLELCIQLKMKAISLDPTLAVAHASMGYWLVLARQYDKAIASGERGLSLAPTSADIISRYASILAYVGRNEEAIQLFKESLRLDPKPNNDVYRHFGTALANVGRYEEAIALQKKAVEQNPDDIFAHMVMASICSMAGREAEAKAAAKEVLRLNPNFSVARIRKVRPDKEPEVAKRWCDTLKQAGLPE